MKFHLQFNFYLYMYLQTEILLYDFKIPKNTDTHSNLVKFGLYRSLADFIYYLMSVSVLIMYLKKIHCVENYTNLA